MWMCEGVTSLASGLEFKECFNNLNKPDFESSDIFLNTTDNSRESGGASRVSGGRDDNHPLSTKRRWIPPSAIRRDAALSQENSQDVIFRKVRGILNKITPENFQKLSNDLLHCHLNSVNILRGVIFLIFEKALDEPKYSSMYAQLCKRLSESAPNFEPPSKPCTFRILLLNKCRTEFENRSKANSEFSSRDRLSPEDEERRQITKRKMLGNIKFIGELGKLEIMAETILHRCIQELLPRKSNSKDMAENVECLCQIMRTCGRILDHENGKGLMQQYFDRLSLFVNDPILPQRVRFMIQDLIELRQEGWVPRKMMIPDGPLPLSELLDDDLMLPSSSSVQNNSNNRNANNGILQSTTDMFRRSLKVRDDIIGPPFPPYPNGFGGASSFRNNNRIGSVHSSVQKPSNNQSVHPPRMNNYNYQNHSGYNNSVQNKHSENGSGASHGSFFNNNATSNANNGTNSERAPTGHVGNDAPPSNAGGSTKDVVPRFKRIFQQGVNLDDVSLRPSANSMVCKPPNLKMSSQNMSKNNGLRPPMTTKAPIQVNESPPIIFKSEKSEKTKNNKKDKTLSKDEVVKKSIAMIDKLIESTELETAVEEYREIKVPDRLITEVLFNILNHIFSNKNAKKEHELVFQFIGLLKNENLISNTNIVDCFRNLTNKMSRKISSIPLIYSHIAAFAAHIISENMMPLSEVADAVDGGKHYPLLLITLQNINKNLGKTALVNLYSESSINLLHTLPESDRTKERLAEILEDRNLAFLFPLLRIESDLWKQLKSDGDPDNLYKWIKDNLENGHFTDSGFVNALVTVLIKYVSQETTFPENSDPSVIPEKIKIEKEKQLLSKFSQLLQTFLNNQIPLQIMAIYAIQVFCYTLNFPKGMLLRWFVNLYELDIIEDEAFLKWREDFNDAYPGKGKALFQVNAWLQWLAEPDSEEEEEDEEEEEKLADI